MKLIVIGLGGIGSQLLFPLYQYLNYEKNFFSQIVLVDGDSYEYKNRSRQMFTELDNKAISSSKYYREKFENVSTIFFDKYITQENINSIVDENDIVLLCVDNNKTRKLFEDFSQTLQNITIISGGNELYDGNVMIINRKNGENITPLFSEMHPELKEPKDKSPSEMSCEELAVSSPQISIVNSTIADIMRRTLFAIFQNGIRYYEVFVNCNTGMERVLKFEDINKKIQVDK